MKYKSWLEEWIELYVKPTTKIRTYEKYKRQSEIHIMPVLGNYELTELTAIVLQRFIVGLSEKGLSANTVNGVVSLLQASLKRAVEINATDKEFSHAVVRPKGKKKRLRVFQKTNKRKSNAIYSIKTIKGISESSLRFIRDLESANCLRLHGITLT